MKLLIKYIIENNIDLRINNKLDNGNTPILQSIIFDDIEMVKLLMNYVKTNAIVLSINKENENEDFPLLNATKNNNTEMVKLLIIYAKENNILLDINKKTLRYLCIVFVYALFYDNIEIVKLLLEYSKENRILFNINKSYYTIDMNNEYHFLINYCIEKNSIEMVILFKYGCRK